MPDCLVLNGTTQYLSRADDSTLVLGGGSFAVGVRVYLTANVTQAFVAKTSTTSVREFQFQYSAAASRVQAAVFDSGGTQYTAASDTFGALSTGAWYWLLLVYDHDNALVKVYVDAVKDQAAVPSPVVDTASTLTVGTRIVSATPGLYSSARMCDLTIWQGAGAVPTDAEVTALYNGGARLRWHEIAQVVPRWARWLRDVAPLDELGGSRIGQLSGLVLAPVNAPGVAAAPDFANADLRQPVTVASGTYTAGDLAGQASAEGLVWTQHGTETQAMTVGSDGLIYRGGTASGLVYLDKVIPSKEIIVERTLVQKSSFNMAAGTVLDLQSGTGNKNGYIWRYDAGNLQWEIGRFVGNTFTSLGTYAATLTNNDVWHYRAISNPLFKELWIKGPSDTEYRHAISAYDDTLSLQAFGRVGDRITGSTASTATTGLHLGPITVKRGTWEVSDVVRLTSAGGTDSTYGGVHVALPVLDTAGDKLHVVHDARYTDFQDGRPMDLLGRSVPISDLAGSWPLTWSSPVTLAAAGNSAIGVGRRNSDPCYWVLPNGDHLVIFSRYDPGYSAIGGDPSPAAAANTGGEGDTDTSHVMMIRSTDGGATWSAAVEITDDVRDTALWGVNYPGQQQGVVLDSGRVVCAMGHKVWNGGSGTNGGEWVYTDSFIGQPSGSPSLASVVWQRGGAFASSIGEHSVAIDGDTLLLLPREYPADSTTWRYAESTSPETAVSALTDLGLYNQPVRTGWYHDGANLIYGHIATPQSGGRQTCRVYAGSSPETLAPVGGGTDYPGLGLIERGGAQYTNVVTHDGYVYVTWGRGGRPEFGADWTQIMSAVGIARASYSSLGLSEPGDGDEVSVWGSVAFSFGGFRMHPGGPR